MTNNTTNSQASEILAKQVAEWRKEVARLNDLIAHAEGRNSQAASIARDHELARLILRWRKISQETPWHEETAAWNAICHHIDAKLAQAYQQGRIDALRMLAPQGQVDTSGLPG